MKATIRCATARIFLAMLSAAFVSCPLMAQQFMARQVDLAYLSQRADVVVQGKVLSVRQGYLPGHRNVRTTEVVMQVEKMLRGPSAQQYAFREIEFGLQKKQRKQTYAAGQRLLLFLPSPSSYGLSSPIGIEQGRFHIARQDGGDMIANEIGNSGLFKNVAAKASKAGRKLSPDQLRVASTRRGPVKLDEFISLTKNLLLMPRIR